MPGFSFISVTILSREAFDFVVKVAVRPVKLIPDAETPSDLVTLAETSGIGGALVVAYNYADKTAFSMPLSVPKFSSASFLQLAKQNVSSIQKKILTGLIRFIACRIYD